MRDFVVRLASLTLGNIKNVKNGTIFMPLSNEKLLSVGGAEILGIYGQNGSGKTAVVDTDESGNFALKGVVPGYYVIRYTYGDGTQEYTDSKGNKIFLA